MKKENLTHVILIIVSVLTLVLVGVQFFGMKSYVNDAIENNEAMKVWGVENYAKLKELYNSAAFKTAQQQQIEGATAQMGWQQANAGQEWGTTAPSTAGQEEFPSGKLSADQLAKMKQGTYVLWKKDAKYTIFEYSDPECPFCIREHNDKTIENVMAKYNGDVNLIIKVVQGVNHPGTEYKSLALLCAGKIWWEKAYYGMYDMILGQSTSSQWGAVAVDKVPTFAQELWLNASTFKSCVDTKELLSTYSANWQEAQAMKASGTPGNLIVNNWNGEYKLVAGAYPVDTFIQVIDGRNK